MSNKLNWGILGTSFISGVMADAIQAEGSTTIYAVAGRSLEPLNEFAKQYNVENTYQDFDALINDENVDIIYIALPNHLHHEYIIKAAEAGKAILSEKSLSVDMEKTDLSLQAVADNGVFFAEGLMYLNHPLIARIAEELNSGSIGKVKSVNGQYVASIAEFVNPGSKGALYNLGCYPVSLMHLIFKQAFGSKFFDNYQLSAYGKQGADGNICDTAVTFQFKSGVLAQLHTAEDHGLHSQFTILGTKGSLTLASNPWLPEATGNQFVVTEYEQTSRVVNVEAKGNGFLYQVSNIREAIERGDKTLKGTSAQPEDSRQIMKLLTDWESKVVVSCI